MTNRLSVHRPILADMSCDTDVQKCTSSLVSFAVVYKLYESYVICLLPPVDRNWKSRQCSGRCCPIR
jgi:hypothetical protein